MCKVSIIMPVYNKEQYVKHTIESILSQSFTEWELLIIDDGSKDKSLQICRTFQDARMKVFSVKHGGVSRARNIGIQHAKGDYLTFIDSDDYIACDYLEKLYHPAYDFILCGVSKVKKDGSILSEVIPEQAGLVKIDAVAKGFYREQLESGIYGYIAGKMFRRKIVIDNQIFFNEMITLAEDYDFYLKIYAVIAEILFLDYTGYYYIQKAGTSAIEMSDDKIDFIQQMQIQKRTKQFLQSKDCFGVQDQERYAKRMSGYVYTVFIMNKNWKYREFLELFSRLKEYVPDIYHQQEGLQGKILTWYQKNQKICIYIVMRLRKLTGR